MTSCTSGTPVTCDFKNQFLVILEDNCVDTGVAKRHNNLAST